jgi:hypothetical protein
MCSIRMLIVFACVCVDKRNGFLRRTGVEQNSIIEDIEAIGCNSSETNRSKTGHCHC